MTKSFRSGVSFLLKCLVVIFALGGVILSFIMSIEEGYNYWLARSLYFTSQSNIWIGVTMLLIIIVDLFFPRAKRFKKVLYFCKYIFTVCITITALIFFFLLAPFADESYHVWAWSSYLTHFFAPSQRSWIFSLTTTRYI